MYFYILKGTLHLIINTIVLKLKYVNKNKKISK